MEENIFRSWRLAKTKLRSIVLRNCFSYFTMIPVPSFQILYRYAVYISIYQNIRSKSKNQSQLAVIQNAFWCCRMQLKVLVFYNKSIVLFIIFSICLEWEKLAQDSNLFSFSFFFENQNGELSWKQIFTDKRSFSGKNNTWFNFDHILL